MANQEHFDILKQGVNIWNRWRIEHPDIQPDLSGDDLSSTNFYKFNLSGANLSGAELINARFGGANLSKADLSYAQLIMAQLISVNLREANLNNALVFGANISGSDLTGASLIETNLARAILGNTNLSGADLTRAKFKEATLRGAILRRVILKDTDLTEANLTAADLTEADLTNGWLCGATLVETNLTKAILTGCKVYGISAWDVQLEGAEQNNLVITFPDKPAITVDNVEIAQFIYMLLKHKKLRDILNATMERGVLLLGRFKDGGLELLQSIAAKLREINYLPIIFDFPKPDNRNYKETVITLAGLSKFVIADLSGPSVPIELGATIPSFKIPFVPIIEKGREVPVMLHELLEESWVLSLVEFASKEHLMELLPSRVFEPAEKKFKELYLRKQ